MIRRRRKLTEPVADTLAAKLQFPKPRFLPPRESADTSELPLRKIHPHRDPGFLHWLTFQACVIEGKTNQRTEIKHVCWSPSWRPRRYVSDPMHITKAISGRLKTDDRLAIPGCRCAHREQEGNSARFDSDYGLDSVAIANDLYARYRRERGIG